MTREKAKEAAEVMLAYADGKEIEFKEKGIANEQWKTFRHKKDTFLCFNFDRFDYRIKSEPTYRPFLSMEECWEEMKRHQPFGWLMLDDMYINVVCVHSVDKRIELSPEEGIHGTEGMSRMFISFNRALNEYLFADGTPFGIKEEMK